MAENDNLNEIHADLRRETDEEKDRLLIYLNNLEKENESLKDRIEKSLEYIDHQISKLLLNYK